MARSLALIDPGGPAGRRESLDRRSGIRRIAAGQARQTSHCDCTSEGRLTRDRLANAVVVATALGGELDHAREPGAVLIVRLWGRVVVRGWPR